MLMVVGHAATRYVHGTRVVCPVLQPSGESRVEVLDFNVHALRAPVAAEKLAAVRLGIDSETQPEGPRLVREPSVFSAEMVFETDVVTALPYYTAPAPGQCEPYVGYMIDEQRLLGLKVRFSRLLLGSQVSLLSSPVLEITQVSPFTEGDLGDVDVYTF
jgi:hypothetical protein